MFGPTTSVRRAINRSFGFFFTIIFLFIFCLSHSQVFYADLEDSTYSSVWLNTTTIDSGFAHSGYQFSVADSAHQYGLGFESEFPENLKGKNTVVSVEGWVKTNNINDQAGFVVSLFKNNYQVLWHQIDLKTTFQTANTWYLLSDSITVPASVTRKGAFKGYLWNNDRKDKVAIDDLKISFKPLKNPSYIPDVKNHIATSPDTPNNLIFTGDYYSIYYEEGSKDLYVYSHSGKCLISNIWYFDHRMSGVIDHKTNTRFILQKIRTKKDKTWFYFYPDKKNIQFKLIIICEKNKPVIECMIKEKYIRNQQVCRESLVIESEADITEVFRANRKSDNQNFKEEYWLDKQGVQFGSGKNSWTIYHQPQISSLQLNTLSKQLWINLDFEKDHPFLHFPLRDDTTDLKYDWSASKYKKRTKRTYSFKIYTGNEIKYLPRMMKNPDGFLATYIWTEHADFTNIRTNRATYFGSEFFAHPDSAIGGFVKYNIPVTKSVFYNNPDSVNNSRVSSGKFTELESSIIEDSLFFNFLKHVREKGTEICLHTPENFTTTGKNMKLALNFMKNEFGSPTWIDHGYNNGIQNNREDIVCDGAVKKSEWYSMKLWEKHDIKYFWNPFYEDYFTFKKWNFGEFIDQPFHGFGDFFPNPDYWRHFSKTGDLIHWPTKSVMYFPNNQQWDFYFTDLALKKFIESWGVEINHCYPAWVDPEKGFWVYDNDSVIVAAPGFNQTLEKMAALRDGGSLNITTIKDFLDYQLALEKVDYEFLRDGRIKITNQSNMDLHGLSFATKARYVLVNDVVPEQKTIGDDIVFWFDLGRGDSKIIRTID